MPGVSRDNDTAEGDLIPSQTTVFANDELVIVDGDDVGPEIAPDHEEKGNNDAH